MLTDFEPANRNTKNYSHATVLVDCRRSWQHNLTLGLLQNCHGDSGPFNLKLLKL